MSTVEEIKRARVSRLTVTERAELLEWLRELSDDWDFQIDRDAAAGKLDRLFDQADEDFESGRCKPL